MLIQPNILFAAEGKKMTRSDICKKNYEKLFNSDWNPNVGSDPEMMAILQKYIFGEVFTVGNLDMKTREMLTVTSLAVQQTLPQLKAHINAALNVGVTPLEVRETLYQCAPFIGFPKTLNAIGVMNEVFKERGIETPLEMAGTTDEKSRRRGEICSGLCHTTAVIWQRDKRSAGRASRKYGRRRRAFSDGILFWRYLYKKRA